MKDVGCWYTSDSPEMIEACLNCKFPDCNYGRCQAYREYSKGQSKKNGSRGVRAYWRYERYKVLVDKGKPDNIIALMLGVKMPTVRRYHQKFIAELEAGG